LPPLQKQNMQIAKRSLSVFLLVASLFSVVNLFAQAPLLKPGEKAPVFKLKNIDGRMISFENYPQAKGFVVVFIANSCPYSKAYEQRITDLDKKFSPLQFPVIAINSNDPEISPGDSFSKMKERAKAKHFSFPYLCDDQQVVADLYGARSTPQVFIVSKNGSDYTLEYLGAIDNDTQNKNPQKINYTEDALNALVNNNKPAINSTKAIGCSISRKKR
jgi:peroxiredoxin